jgi:predicted ester cyclase
MDLTLRGRREQIVRDHMDAENRLDFDAALASFARPRYELIGLDTVFDGAGEVAEYFRRSREPFPDQHNELIALHHADDAVVVELWLMGTHLGPLGDLAPTGRKFRVRVAAVFVFEGADLVCERVYFNPGTIRAQLTGRETPS